MNPQLEKTMSMAVIKMARNAGFDAILVADEQDEQFQSAEVKMSVSATVPMRREEAELSLT